MSSVQLCRAAALVYPIMLAQQAGEISESKAAELLNLDIESCRSQKNAAVKAIVELVEQLPSPLTLLLNAMMGQQSLSTKKS
jgi:hypothetical protein